MFLNHIYQLIKQRIETQVPQIKEFGWYMGQGTSNFKGGLVTCPGCYLEYGTIDTSTQGKRIQNATVPFTLHLISDNLKESTQRMTEDANFEHLSIVAAIFEALSNYSPMLSELPQFLALVGTPDDYNVFTSSERLNITTDHTNRSIIRTTQRFATTAKDYSATKKYTTINRPLQIEKLVLIPSPPFQN